MAITISETLIEAPAAAEEIHRHRPQVVAAEGAINHHSLKQEYPEYQQTYKFVKENMRLLVEQFWEEGKLKVRTTDDDDVAFYDALEELKSLVAALFIAYVTENFPSLTQNWMLNGLEREEFGMVQVAFSRLTQETRDDHDYGKLGDLVYNMEADRIFTEEIWL